MSYSAKAVFVAFTASLLASLPAGAWAEKESLLQGGSPAVASMPAEEQIPGMKSETTALLLSLLGTVVPMAMSAPFVHGGSSEEGSDTADFVFLGALVLGPSLGHFYAGRPLRALAGIGVRTACLFATAAGLALSWDSESTGGAALLVGGLIIGGAAAVWDIIGAPQSARVHNDRLREEEHRVSIFPALTPRGVGLSVNVSF